jgi:hypothetical protein
VSAASITRNRSISSLLRIIVLVGLTVILLITGCSRNLTEPTDQELITIFGEQRDAFRQLQQMASEDLQNSWYFNWPNFNGSAPSPSRRQHYMTLASRIPQCFSVYTDYDGHIRFCFAEGSYQIWPPYPRWVKGIEFWPHGCPWVMLTNLDNARTLPANVYAREIEPKWFLFYQRDDN